MFLEELHVERQNESKREIISTGSLSIWLQGKRGPKLWGLLSLLTPDHKLGAGTTEERWGQEPALIGELMWPVAALPALLWFQPLDAFPTLENTSVTQLSSYRFQSILCSLIWLLSGAPILNVLSISLRSQTYCYFSFQSIVYVLKQLGMYSCNSMDIPYFISS